MTDDEITKLVRKNYFEVNQGYINEQIAIASQFLTEEQKAELQRQKQKEREST